MSTQPAFREDHDSRDIEALRQRTIDTLTEAFASDAITLEEYERRAALASAAFRPAAFDELVLDLPVPRPAKPNPAPSRASRRDYDRAAAATGNHDLIGATPVTTGCVMGDRSLVGNWLTSDHVSAFTVMGSTKLDLRDADLPPGPVKIEVFTLMGETKIIVPPGLPVRLSAFAFMGESRADRDVNQQVRGAQTWIEISGFVMMGDLRVRVLG